MKVITKERALKVIMRALETLSPDAREDVLLAVHALLKLKSETSAQ